MSRSRGSARSTFRRLCSRAPRTTIVSLIGGQATRSAEDCRTPVRASTDLAKLSLELVNLVAQARGLLEAQIAGGVLHLVGEALDETPKLVAGQVEPFRHGRPAASAATPPAAATRRGRAVAVVAHADHLEDVGDLLTHGLRVDAVLLVVCELLLAA